MQKSARNAKVSTTLRWVALFMFTLYKKKIRKFDKTLTQCSAVSFSVSFVDFEHLCERVDTSCRLPLRASQNSPDQHVNKSSSIVERTD